MQEGIDRATCFVREGSMQAELGGSALNQIPHYRAHVHPTVTMKRGYIDLVSLDGEAARMAGSGRIRSPDPYRP